MAVLNPALHAQESQPAPNANEQKILAALDDRTEFEFVDQPLTDVVEYLKQRHEIEIQLDSRALSDEGVGSDTPITRNVKGISLESGLGLMLEQLDLTFLVHHEVLYITSKSHEEPTTRVYPVGDLVTVTGDKGANGEQGGMWVNGRSPEEARQQEAYEELVQVIASAIAPEAKDVSSVCATVQKLPAAEALSITQTFQSHRKIERLLASIRAVKRQQTPTPSGESEEKACDPARPKGKRGRRRA
jgi:hypothetical protein